VDAHLAERVQLLESKLGLDCVNFLLDAGLLALQRSVQECNRALYHPEGEFAVRAERVAKEFDPDATLRFVLDEGGGYEVVLETKSRPETEQALKLVFDGIAARWPHFQSNLRFGLAGKG
jgi:hypothetical protein